MPVMKRDSTLRLDPGGAVLPAIGPEGARVDVLGQTRIQVLGVPQDWTKVHLIGADEPSTGWVQADRVDDSGIAAAGQIDEVKFARACWLEALIADVTPHYLVAVAQLRSSRSQASLNGDTGPFGFSQGEWDACCQDPSLALTDFRPSDIADWGMQVVAFAAVTARLQTDLQAGIASSPSASQLLLAQMVGAVAAAALIKQPAVMVDAALNGDAGARAQPGNVAELIARFAPLLGTVAQPSTGQQALGALTAALQPVLDATRTVVDGVGKEYSGTIDHDGSIAKADDRGPVVKPPAVKPPKNPRPGGPSVVAGAGGPLGELIAKHESGRAGYGAFNRGTAGVGGQLDFSRMTLNQVVAMQAVRDSGTRLFAVGKYQMIPTTMRAAIAQRRLTGTEKFGPGMQEILFRHYLVAVKRPAVKAFITGKGSLRPAQMALAFEFAAVARPDTGLSAYGRVGGNRASISAAEIHTALEQEAALFKQMTDDGNGDDDAWTGLSPGIA